MQPESDPDLGRECTHAFMDNQAAALPLEREVLAARRLYSDERDISAAMHNNLATTLKQMGNFSEARQLCDQVMETYRRTASSDDPDLHTIVVRSASLYSAMGDHELALPLYEEVLTTHQRILGHQHPETLESLGRTGSTKCMVGNYDAGVPMLREAVRGLTELCGRDHYVTQKQQADLDTALANLRNVRALYGENALNTEAAQSQPAVEPASKTEANRKKKEQKKRAKARKLAASAASAASAADAHTAVFTASAMTTLEVAAAAGLDDRSIAQADDDDWESFGISVEDGRQLRREMRQKMGYDDAPGGAPATQADANDGAGPSWCCLGAVAAVCAVSCARMLVRL